MSGAPGGAVGHRRWWWPALAAPGVVWLIVLFVIPFYAILAVAFGASDAIFGLPIPAWNPINWNYTTFGSVVSEIASGGGTGLRPVFIRTLRFVGISVAICFVIGYPVAYYVSRHAGRMKIVLLTLIIAPFWVSYLMRMLAWVNLLSDEAASPGLVNRILLATPFVDQPINWFAGRAAPVTVVLGLVYGYVPFFILPLFAALDRIDDAHLEAARDLGASAASTFLRVTLPLSRQGILAGTVIIMLPMFGDYYTPTLMSGQPSTTMTGNQIDFWMHNSAGQARAASITLLLSAFVGLLMLYYLRSTARAAKAARG